MAVRVLAAWLCALFLCVSAVRGADFVVNTTRDTVNTNNGLTSLRDAILAYNGLDDSALGNNTITFDLAVFGGTRQTITLNGTPLPVIKTADNGGGYNLAITAPPVGLVIDARSQSRIFQTIRTTHLTLNGITLTGGNAPTGGAILNDTNATLVVVNCTFRGNRADNGGAIYSTTNSFLTV